MTPASARERWLARYSRDGQHPTTVRLAMTGRIKLRAWFPFVASQWIDAQRGFVWAARVGRRPLVISGVDQFLDGSGAMDWRFWGRWRLVAASGPDVTRSAAWRFAAEALTWLPAGTSDVTWQEVASGDSITAVRQLGDEAVRIELRIAEDGRLVSASGLRWGNPLDKPFGYYPFGVDIHAEITRAGITVPSAFTASWFHGEPEQAAGEFFRAVISDVRFGEEPG